MVALSRRTVLAGLLLTGARGAEASQASGGDLREGIAALERRHGGRLGVAVLDAGRPGATFAHRGDERFPLCSTFKCLAAAFVLARVDRGEESLCRRVAYAKEALLPYSPVTAGHVGGGMTVGELCEAAMSVSDNAAANLLLDGFGGPPALTAFLRSLGDETTRLDHREPLVNSPAPGDPSDSTTPIAMAETLRRTVLGPALSPSSRAQLAAWLLANKVGDKRRRAGLPADWRVGDRTGSGARQATNDVAVIWPPGRAPMIVAAYYVDARAGDDDREAVLADVGRLVARL